MTVQDIIRRVPGVPATASDEFDLTADGILSASDRKILRYLLKAAYPDVSAGYLAGLRAIGDLRAFGEERDAAEPALLDHDSYVARSVYMRPMMPSDHEALYFSALEPTNAHRWRFRGRTVSFPEFSQSLGVGSLAEFVFAATDSNALVAYCSAYNYDPVARHATFAVQRVAHDERFDTVVIESTALFLNYLFNTFNVRKVFAEIPAYNFAVFGLVRDVFQMEGRKADYHWHAGQYWDEVAISTSREAWLAFASHFFEQTG